MKSAYDRFKIKRSQALDLEGFEGKKMDRINQDWRDPPTDEILALKLELEEDVKREKAERPPPEKKPKKGKATAAPEPPAPAAEPAAVEDLDAASTSAAGGMDQEELD